MPTFGEIIRDLVAKKGQGTVADLIGMDPTRFCRALSGQNGGFKESEIDTLLKLAGYELLPVGFKKRFLNWVNMLLDIIEALRTEYGIKVNED